MGRRSDHRLDLTASELRKAAQREKDSTAARRMLALALVLEGADRRRAAESCGMDRQTLRDWVHRLAWPGFGRASRLVLFRNSPRSRRPNWPHRACRSRAPIRRSMGWCAGGGSIYATGLSDASASHCTSARSAKSWQSSAIAASRCARVIRKPTKRLRRNSKKLLPRPLQRRSLVTPKARRSKSASRTKRGSASRAR